MLNNVKSRITVLTWLICLGMVGLSISVKIYHGFNLSKTMPASLFFLINPFLWLVFLSFFSIVYSKTVSYFADRDFMDVWKADLVSYSPFLFAGMTFSNIFAFKYLALAAIALKLYYLYKFGIIKKIISAIIPESVEDVIAIVAILLMTVLISNNLIAIGISDEDTGTIQRIGERIANSEVPSLEWDIGAPGQPVTYRWDLAMPFTYTLVAVVHNLYPTHETIFILNIIFFVLFAIVLYKGLGHFFDKRIALVTLVLFIFNPQVPWVVRVGLPYMISWFFILLACISYFYAHEKQEKSFFVLSGICTALSILAVPFFSFVLIFPVLLEVFFLFQKRDMQKMKNLLRNIMLTAIGGIMVYLFFSIYFYHYTNGIPFGESLIKFYRRLMEARAVNVLYAPNAVLWPVPLNLVLPLLASIQVILAERPAQSLMQLVFLSCISLMMILFIYMVLNTAIKKLRKKGSHYDLYYTDIFVASLFVIYLIVFSLLIRVFVERWVLGYLLLIYIMISRILFGNNLNVNILKKYSIYFMMVVYSFAAFSIQYPKYSGEAVSPYKQAALYIEQLSDKSGGNVLCLTKDGTYLAGTVYLKNYKYLNDNYIKDLVVFSDFISKNNISFIFYNKKIIPQYYEKFWRRSNRELSLVESFIQGNNLQNKIINIGNFSLVNLK